MPEFCDNKCAKCGVQIVIDEPRNIGTSNEFGYQPGSKEKYRALQKEHRTVCSACAKIVANQAKKKRNRV